MNFNIEVNLVEAGEYAVTAELYAGDQLITQSGDFFDLASGAQTITLPFDGDAIRQAGLHGPYTITNLYLTPIEVGITAQSGIDVLQTPAYKYTQFGYENNTPTFADVPFNGFGWAHIEAIYNAGITGGCTTNPLNYCPNNTVTRAQMAIFLLRGIHGSSYTPPAVGDGTGFNDVPTTHSAAAWIKRHGSSSWRRKASLAAAAAAITVRTRRSPAPRWQSSC
ncbi:MAG: hypothetical protein QY328_14590 [Anaerolineales bacterium]|nr:MAG: hypothetical protein QY328_14590 [Anaerolineales bacterium]